MMPPFTEMESHGGNRFEVNGGKLYFGHVKFDLLPILINQADGHDHMLISVNT